MTDDFYIYVKSTDLQNVHNNKGGLFIVELPNIKHFNHHAYETALMELTFKKNQEILDNILILLDIATFSVVGSQELPILRRLPLETLQTSWVHIIYNYPFYVPVSQTEVNKIAISIVHEADKSVVDFSNSPVSLVLHFRRKLW